MVLTPLRWDDRPVNSRTTVAGVLLTACALAAGCGVQAEDDVDAAACAEVKAFVEIKDETAAIDQAMLDLRPTSVTPESVRALVPRYEEARDDYDALLMRASGQLDRSRTEESDSAAVWRLTAESLAIRRDGFAFFAEAFADPASFRDPMVVAESESWLRKTEDANARLEGTSSQWFRDHGFEETDDGNFIIDC